MKDLTAKEKAEELVDKYRTYIRMADKYGMNLSADEIYFAKQCAIIAVDEIIKEIHELGEVWMKRRIQYWLEVKSEIEKL